MSTVSLRLPTSLHEKVREVSEQLAAFLTVDYLEGWARRGSQEKFDAVLSKVPDVEPEAHDRL